MNESHILEMIDSHLCLVADAVVDADNPMWPSVVDTRTHECPGSDVPPSRVYRKIGAPRGSTLYWDQPLIVAARALSEVTGKPNHARRVDAYLSAFLDRCVDESGMFLWGNHRYFDLFDERIVEFGHFHELRPITPAWELFYRLAPERTVDYIAGMGRRHVYDPASGGFNRHDDGERGHAFLEAGGVLAESLAWAGARSGRDDLCDMAIRIARYSYTHRNGVTGLVRNEPDHGRWDSKVTTTEVGLWTQSLLRAAGYTDNRDLVDIGRVATEAYLRFGYDCDAGRYYGQVAVETGEPVFPEAKGYRPNACSDPWSTDQWPTHDYPMPLAEACISLFHTTKEPVFADAVHRWVRIAYDDRPSLTGDWTYAGQYGRCIHLLARSGRELEEPRLLARAETIAQEAVEALYEHGMFQGYPGGHLYESVDGVGILLLALLDLVHQGELEFHGLGF